MNLNEKQLEKEYSTAGSCPKKSETIQPIRYQRWWLHQKYLRQGE